MKTRYKITKKVWESDDPMTTINETTTLADARSKVEKDIYDLPSLPDDVSFITSRGWTANATLEDGTYIEWKITKV